MDNYDTAEKEMAVPLKYLGKFWNTLEMMSITNCEINLILAWSANCVLDTEDGATTLATTDTKCYAPVVTLSTQDNTKQLEQLQLGFKRTFNCKNVNQL